MESMYSVKEVAEKLKVCPRTVWRLVQRGELPHYVKVGSSARWVCAEIAAYIERIKSLRPQA